MEDAAVVSRIVHESYERAAPLMPKGHWWEHLDDDFARTSEKFDLARVDREFRIVDRKQLQGRFDHLFRPEKDSAVIADIQARVDSYWEGIA